jgi:hypothetical protein
MICSSQKTLAFGLPFIKTAFSTRKDLSTILTPLLIFSPTQLFCATTILVPLLKNEITKSDTKAVPSKLKVRGGRFASDWGVRHKLKTILSTVCLLSVFFELCDEALRDIPFLKEWVSHISFVGKKFRLPSLGHSVFLLSASHAIHALEEVYNHYVTQSSYRKEAEKAAKILQISTNRYDSEVEAARAVDQVALMKYGPFTALNFKESAMDLLAGPKSSRFKGVEWDEAYKAWRVSPAVLDD